MLHHQHHHHAHRQDPEEASLLPSVLLSIFVFYLATVIGSVLLLIFSIWLWPFHNVCNLLPPSCCSCLHWNTLVLITVKLIGALFWHLTPSPLLLENILSRISPGWKWGFTFLKGNLVFIFVSEGLGICVSLNLLYFCFSFKDMSRNSILRMVCCRQSLLG